MFPRIQYKISFAFFLVTLLFSVKVLECQTPQLIASNTFVTDEFSTSVTFNDRTRSFLVLWTHSTDEFGVGATIRGRQIRSDNTLTPVRQYTKPNQKLTAIEMASACCTRANKTLLVWDDLYELKEPLHTRLLNFNGRPAGPIIPLKSGGTIGNPLLEYHPLTDQFLFIAIGAYFVRLDSDGRKINPPTLVEGLQPLFLFSDPSKPEYFLIVRVYGDGLFLLKLDSEGKRINSPKKIFGSNIEIIAIEFHRGFKEFVLCYRSGTSNDSPVKFQRFRLDGQRIGSPKILTSVTMPIVTAIRSGYLIAYLRDDTLYSRVLNRQGVIVGTEKPILNPSSNRFRSINNISYDSVNDRVLLTYIETPRSLWGMFLNSEK